jgi:hypothetical protein
MKTLLVCAALVAMSAPMSGCQHHEPTRPAQSALHPESGSNSGCAQSASTGPIGFVEALRRRHMDLP